MNITVFLAVILAAFLHALWNAMVKGGGDKHLNMAALHLGSLPIAIGLLPFVQIPAQSSWPYLAAGVLLHFGYNLFLLFSYRIGDLTQVYPLARGTAPLLVAGISVFLLEVQLKQVEIVAVLLIGVGIISISFARQHNGERNVKASMLAVTTGCFIAAYSLVDGIGVRLAGSAVGFYCWLAIINAVLFSIFVGITRPGLISTIPARAKAVFVLGGNASFIAFSLVLWAFTQAPIALVTALRETSIIFALLFGIFFLKERLNLLKICSISATLLGAALLGFSK